MHKLVSSQRYPKVENMYIWPKKFINQIFKKCHGQNRYNEYMTEMAITIYIYIYRSKKKESE